MYRGVLILDRASIIGLAQSIPDRVYQHRGDWDTVELTLWNTLQIYRTVRNDIILMALREHIRPFSDYQRFGKLAPEAKRLVQYIRIADVRAIKQFEYLRQGLVLGLADLQY